MRGLQPHLSQDRLIGTVFPGLTGSAVVKSAGRGRGGSALHECGHPGSAARSTSRRLRSGPLRLASYRVFGRGSCSLGPLPHNLWRALVVAKSAEARLAQPTIACPLGKTNLGNQFGAGPMRAARNRPHLDKRRRRRLHLS